MGTSNRQRGARSGWERRRELGAPAAYGKDRPLAPAGATSGGNGDEPSLGAPTRPVIWRHD